MSSFSRAFGKVLQGRRGQERTSKEFARELLNSHNDYRKTHGVPTLSLSSKMCRDAQSYAESLARTRVLKHSSDTERGQCGENLAWASYDEPAKEVAERWYAEIQNYNFSNPGFSSGSGHFTAMVWRSSRKLGVGRARASDGSTFVVARYFPAGNVVNPGQFRDNVPPAGATARK
ncbi:unnamed protein product [Lampetra fluviatilis]